MGVILCNNVTNLDVDDISGIGCGSDALRGQAIIDIVNYLCQNCFNEITCFPSSTNPDDLTIEWESANNACTPDCGNMAVFTDGAGLTDLYMYDGTNWNQLTLNKEFRVGISSDFVDDENPTALELTTLFGGAISPHSLVYVESTKTFWITRNSGILWTKALSHTLIAITDRGAFASGNKTRNGGYTSQDSGVLYNNGTDGDTPLQPIVGDYVTVNINIGYRIIQYATVVNPVDAVRLRIVLTGSVNDTITFDNLSNGFEDTFTKTYIATANGAINFDFQADLNGTLGAPDWIWQTYSRYKNTSVLRKV